MTQAAAGRTAPAGLLTEPRLAAAGLPHGFTTARDGDMADPERRARAGLGAVRVLRQVHGVRVRDAASCDGVVEGDGWVSRSGPVGVFTADCLPLLVWSDAGDLVGAFHAGWRGLADGIVEAAVAAMAAAGAPASRLNVHLGPRIGPCCYEVGPEVAGRFDASSVRSSGPKPVLDLSAEAALRLSRAGVPSGRVTASPLCTACRPGELFSWRRDGVRRNMLSFIAPRGAA